jgi:hypothetical protein
MRRSNDATRWDGERELEEVRLHNEERRETEKEELMVVGVEREERIWWILGFLVFKIIFS